MKLKYTNQLLPSSWDPMEKWEEGLPIGNGRLGAMIMGVVNTDIIQINEDSVWSGAYQERDNKDTRKNLSFIREKVRSGEIEEVEKYILPMMCGTPSNMRVYQTAGNLSLNFSHKKITEYRRELDLDTATAVVTYTENDINYKREYFSSFTDDLIIIKLSANKENSISFSANLGRGIHTDKSGIYENCIFMNSGNEGLNFSMLLGVKNRDGKVLFTGDHLIIEKATEVILYLDCRTSYREKNHFEKAYLNIKKAKTKGFNQLKKEHIDFYENQYKKMSFNLVKESNHTTNYLLENIEDNIRELTQLYVNFSRYLMISSSQKGTLPANLQGIWCKDMDPPWGSKFTININAQMNYWPTDLCNLSDSYEPFFSLIEKIYKNGKNTARNMYGCRGFVAHSNTNIFGDCAPQDYWMPGTTWVMGAAWMCTHIFEHYEYELDLEFLRRYYYLIEEACLFFVDFMELNEGGVYVCNPSLSPENSYKLPNGAVGTISYGSVMDSQILRLLMGQYKKASKLLNTKTKNYDDIIHIFNHLPMTELHSNGTIKEWLEEYEEHEVGHRHISHLFGLFPGDEIRRDEKLMEASKKTIERRLKNGGAHTGWSRAWIMNFYAVLKDSDEVHKNLIKLYKNSTLPNLLDNHPPFQIDGNFGALNAILLSYVQILDNTIYLLPACPLILRTGEVLGIRLKGNIEIDLKFKDFELESLVLRSKKEIKLSIIFEGRKIEVELKNEKEINLNRNQLY